jgi:hypothetical protein
VSKRKPPPWIEEEKVRAWVDEELEYQADMEEYYFAMLPWDTAPGIRPSDFRDSNERKAVEAAQRGDVGPLVSFISPPDNLKNSARMSMSLRLETWRLIVEFLTGRRNLGNGKLRGKGGRPKMSSDERRAKNPNHDAVDLSQKIQAMLRRLYPDQPAEQINPLADEIAADRITADEIAADKIIAGAGAAERGRKLRGKTVRNLRRRAKNTGHRIKP